MPVSKISRASGLVGKAGFPNANSVRVDSTAETLIFGTGASGTTEKTAVDTTSVQTLTNKLQPVTTTAVDGAIAIASGIVRLTKGSAAAMTLAAPTAAQAGTTITITAGSAFAHVVTATSLIEDGVTGGAKSAWTSAAFVGSSITLIAVNLEWYVLSKNLGTIA